MPTSDPRTVARNIPGLFDAIFPQLTPGIVAHYNRKACTTDAHPVSYALVQQTSIQRAMLFEIGFAIGEKLLSNSAPVWDECVQVAIERQSCHFDAKIPATFTAVDRDVAEIVGKNMASMANYIANERQSHICLRPKVPGFQWISSGHGDLSAGSTLIEVKCSNKNFSSADYRQVVMYWLLSFSSSIENKCLEWSEIILMNPRSASYVAVEFDELLNVISAGRTKVEIFQIFSTLIATRNER